MSDRVRALVWDWYEERWGAPMILAVALADAANDSGAAIAESVVGLAKKTRQSDRAVRKQLRALESAGLLSVDERSAGGRGNVTRYRLNLTMLVSSETRNGVQGLDDAKPGTAFRVSDPETRNGVQGFGDRHIKAVLKPSSSNASGFRVSGDALDAEDERLARWMFDRIRVLNASHREPAWPAWQRDVRRMRERDKRGHREIAELFDWANRDPFWQVNVLSPGTLRRQWDRLVLQRRRATGAVDPGAPPPDRVCAHVHDGQRCQRPGVRSDGTHLGAKWYCADHAEELDSVRA